MGIVAFWALLVLGLSYYARARIGVQRWRRLHRFAALAWLLGLAHSLGEGTDAGQAWFLAMLAIVAAPAIALLLERLLRSTPTDRRGTAAPARRRTPAPSRPARSCTHARRAWRDDDAAPQLRSAPRQDARGEPARGPAPASAAYPARRRGPRGDAVRDGVPDRLRAARFRARSGTRGQCREASRHGREHQPLNAADTSESTSGESTSGVQLQQRIGASGESGAANRAPAANRARAANRAPAANRARATNASSAGASRRDDVAVMSIDGEVERVASTASALAAGCS